MLILAALFLTQVASTQAAPSPPRAQAAFVLPDMAGLVEGIAYRAKTGAYYFGDVRKRCVWRRDADGRVTRLGTPDERLLGVFRLVVDERRGVLVAAMSALPQMEGYTEAIKGRAGIAELDIETGAVRRVALVPADGANHVIGDFAVTPDGTIFATDSAAPILWRLLSTGSKLEPFIRSELFGSLQGIAPCAVNCLLVTDYKAGVVRVDTATKQVRRLTAPAGTEMRGLDTFLWTGNGTFVAIQNGTKTQRVLQLVVDSGPSAVAHVETIAEDPAMVDATLGTFAGSDFVFIADGGWNLFEPNAPAPAPRGVPVLKISLKP